MFEQIIKAKMVSGCLKVESKITNGTKNAWVQAHPSCEYRLRGLASIRKIL